jgi:predicted DNA-binding transcriptional regulator
MVNLQAEKENYWNTEILHDTWVYISCPIMDSQILPFSIKRKIVVQLQEIEKYTKEYNLKGWIGYAKLSNPHIMIMYLKVGAIPYKIDAIEQKMWFKKELL